MLNHYFFKLARYVQILSSFVNTIVFLWRGELVLVNCTRLGIRWRGIQLRIQILFDIVDIAPNGVICCYWSRKQLYNIACI